MDKKFFHGIKKQSITLPTGDKIDLPVEYYDWTWIYAAFPVPVKNVKKILPTAKLQPILFFPGITLVQIGAFEYHQINGLAPYNEVGVTIPVQYEPKSNYPGKPIIHFPLFFPEKYSRFGVYIHRLPVTTQESYTLGKDIWGFPKTVDEITFQETETYRQCTVLSDGKEALSIEVKKMSTRLRQIDFYCYTVNEGKLLRTQIQTQGQYGIVSKMPGGAKFVLGTGPLAEELRTLGIGNTAFGRIYATGVQSMLHAASEQLDM
jgi:hypothetical protein